MAPFKRYSSGEITEISASEHKDGLLSVWDEWNQQNLQGENSGCVTIRRVTATELDDFDRRTNRCKRIFFCLSPLAKFQPRVNTGWL